MRLYKIKKSKIDNKGRGLYAAKDIKEGEKIIDYKGKIITNKYIGFLLSNLSDSSTSLFVIILPI